MLCAAGLGDKKFTGFRLCVFVQKDSLCIPGRWKLESSSTLGVISTHVSSSFRLSILFSRGGGGGYERDRVYLKLNLWAGAIREKAFVCLCRYFTKCLCAFVLYPPHTSVLYCRPLPPHVCIYRAQSARLIRLTNVKKCVTVTTNREREKRRESWCIWLSFPLCN